MCEYLDSAPIAQWLEQVTHNHRGGGSSPSGSIYYWVGLIYRPCALAIRYSLSTTCLGGENDEVLFNRC